MDFRSEKGVSGIDIVASVIIVTIFIAIIANIIANINLNSKDIEKKTQATSYAVDEIEIIKAEGYVESYQDKGINQEDIILEEDINDENGNFSGYHKKISIKDYVLIKDDKTKQANIVKEITVEISYMNRKGTQNVQISTYVTKE